MEPASGKRHNGGDPAAIDVIRLPLPSATDCASVRPANPLRRTAIPSSAQSDQGTRAMPVLLTLARPAIAPGAPHRLGCVLGLGLAVALAVAASAPALAQAPDPVVARVDGKEIRSSDIALAEEDIGSNLAQMPPAGKRDYVTTYLTDMILVAKAAEAKNIPDNEDFKRRLTYFRNKILMEMLLQSEAKTAITDAALHKLYDEATKQMTAEKEVRARHILVETEDEAKAVLAEIKKGGDFAELAKTKSKDPGAADGGDLGYFTKEQMVPEFAEVAFKLDKGQISDPVKTQFGWHVIKVEDKRDRPIPEFDKVKDQLESYLSRRAQAELVGKLRADAKIERLEPKTPDPATPPAPPEPKKN
jgi:peptidyl-prolyl cis-trans isomerase C